MGRHYSLILSIILLILAAFTVAAFAASATLNWTDNSNNEMGFSIQRKAEACTGTGTWADLASVGANIQTYRDSAVTEGTTYCYRVNAWNTVDGSPGGTKQYSAWSNTAGATVPFGTPAAPGSLGITVQP